MGFLADCLLLLHFLFGLEGEVSDQPIDFAVVFFLLFLELLGHGLALLEFSGDDFFEFVLFLLTGGGVVDNLVHEAGDIILESGGNLFNEVGSFLFFLFELVFEQSQFLVHDLDELVLFILALDDLPFDFGGQKLGELL